MARMMDSEQCAHEAARERIPRGREEVRVRFLELRDSLRTFGPDSALWYEFLECGQRLHEYEVRDRAAVMVLPGVGT